MRQETLLRGLADCLCALGWVPWVLVWVPWVLVWVPWVLVWNTRYVQRAVDALRADGAEVRGEDVARLSPLGYAHISILDRYPFVVPESVRRGEFRPLRKPTSASDTTA